MPAASPALVAALKTSIAAPDAAWSVIGYARSTRSEMSVDEVGLMTMIPREDVTIALSSPVVRVGVGALAPLNIAYIGHEDGAGGYLGAEIYVDGVALTVDDVALHNQALSLAGSTAASIDANVTASLVIGPQVFPEEA